MILSLQLIYIIFQNYQGYLATIGKCTMRPAKKGIFCKTEWGNLLKGLSLQKDGWQAKREKEGKNVSGAQICR
jgi:hypothetical protein